MLILGFLGIKVATWNLPKTLYLTSNTGIRWLLLFLSLSSFHGFLSMSPVCSNFHFIPSDCLVTSSSLLTLLTVLICLLQKFIDELGASQCFKSLGKRNL